MPKTLQNIVILMEDNSHPSIISMKAGNMCLNRICISENDSFELSGVYFLKKYKPEKPIKGKGYPNKWTNFLFS